jgi:hypothetical protein
MHEHGENITITTIRGFLLLIFIAGVLGTGAELLLLEHTEDFKQWIPLVLMSLSLVVLAGAPSPAGLRACASFRRRCFFL